jgi:FPC/CPF motif-containing protein YcgG
MTRTELLLEHLSNADDIKYWWEEFDSIEEAREILKEVKKEDHDERESAALISFFDEPELSEIQLHKAFNKCLSVLNKYLNAGIRNE